MTRKMKNSGVEWIGEIPEGWGTVRLKYLCSIRSGAACTTETDNENGFPIYGANGQIGFSSKRNVIKDSILTGRVGTLGTYRVIKDVWASDNVLIIEPKDRVNLSWLYYALTCVDIQELSSKTSQPLITASKFYDIDVPHVSLRGQAAIAEVLSQRTKEIDEIRDNIANEIVTLRQYKKSLITEAVTKGLNKNVPMKDSGIVWIGEIPEHWKIRRVKQLFEILNGSTPSSSTEAFWDGDINWITPADMKDFGEISGGSRAISKLGYMSCGTNLLPIGSIVISSRAPIGKVNITTDELCTNQGCKSLVRQNDNNKYFYYQFLASTERLLSLGRGTTFLELSTEDLKNLILVVPPKEEQSVIANHLDNQSDKIDSAIRRKQRQLQTLEDYKKSIIYEYVTGKKEVPHD